MCIIISVKESSFDVIVHHISSLTSFSFIVELVFYFGEKGKRMMCLPLLFTGAYDRYVSSESGTTLRSFDSKSKITRKEAMLSWHLLRDSIYLKFNKWCIKRNIMFSGRPLMCCCDYVEKRRQGPRLKVTLHVHILIINRRTNDSKCDLCPNVTMLLLTYMYLIAWLCWRFFFFCFFFVVVFFVVVGFC